MRGRAPQHGSYQGATMPKTKPKAPREIAALDPATSPSKLRCAGGSGSDDFNNILINQTLTSLWTAHSDETSRSKQLRATLAALMGIAPRDELEGMLAAQMVAAHNNTMECHRRAMIA